MLIDETFWDSEEGTITRGRERKGFMGKIT